VSYLNVNLTLVIPIPPKREKESRFEIATPACHNTALRCAGTSHKLLAMTMLRIVRDSARVIKHEWWPCFELSINCPLGCEMQGVPFGISFGEIPES
jgi:hypothetical protein